MVIELFLIGVGLSMDAFAVSVCKGLGMEKINKKHAFLIGLYFGGFQALMPFLGWALGIRFQKYITSVDHWIAFGLLAVVGGKMIWEASKPRDADEDAGPRRSGPWALIATAIGTSIDAAAVGVGLAFIGADIWLIAASIGCTTFVLTTVGMLIGKSVGARFGKTAELLGGIALICLGVGILLEHLGVFAA